MLVVTNLVTIGRGLKSPPKNEKYSTQIFYAAVFFQARTHLGYKYSMRKTYQFLSLSPAPLFFLGFVISVINPQPICGSWPYEMSVMWLIMCLAHVIPWLLWFQQRNLTRN